jgi:hypothetical protein
VIGLHHEPWRDDDIQPKAVLSPDELKRWNALPPERQLARLRAAIGQGVDSNISDREGSRHIGSSEDVVHCLSFGRQVGNSASNDEVDLSLGEYQFKVMSGFIISIAVPDRFTREAGREKR